MNENCSVTLPHRQLNSENESKAINTMKHNSSRNFQVCLNNQTGAEVFTTSIKSLRDNHQITLALPDLAPGVYFINVFLNQEIVYSSKLICSK